MSLAVKHPSAFASTLDCQPGEVLEPPLPLEETADQTPTETVAAASRESALELKRIQGGISTLAPQR